MQFQTKIFNRNNVEENMPIIEFMFNGAVCRVYKNYVTLAGRNYQMTQISDSLKERIFSELSKLHKEPLLKEIKQKVKKAKKNKTSEGWQHTLKNHRP
jgi:hypothetical protein